MQFDAHVVVLLAFSDRRLTGALAGTLALNSNLELNPLRLDDAPGHDTYSNPMKKSLLETVRERRLVCDGAMGTQLMARGLASGACGMTWNLDRPGDVGGIHLAYRNAGCDLITTNSFGGSRFALEMHGLAGRVAELNCAAAQVARAAAGENAWVLGDVGPFGDFLEPVGDVTADELRAAFQTQIAALIAAGANAILVETMSDPAEAVVGVEAAKACNKNIPVIVTYSFQKAGSEFRTMMGTSAAEAMQRAIAAGADIVGTNCGTELSLDDYIILAGQLVAAAGKTPVIVQPNGGSPHLENGKTIYKATPEEMAATTTRLLAAGVRIIGGCCGTTPEHLAAMSSAVRAAKT
jgi:5-methyltetrahydrofolate--homocysteine methyltransferase